MDVNVYDVSSNKAIEYEIMDELDEMDDFDMESIKQDINRN